jgi:transcriptional regulator with PAS, ATPase and Fis domain
MKKRLGIVTSSVDVGKFYKKQLFELFGDFVEISTFSFDVNNNDSIEDVDVLLISTYSQYEVLKKYINHDNIEIVISRLTLSKEGFSLLKNSNVGKKAALVNLSFEMCIETIATLYQLGFDDYELIPVYPNMDTVPYLDAAITTGEKRFVPQGTKHALDLGNRVLDKNTIVDTAIALDLEDVLAEKVILEYFDNLVSYNKGVDYFISKTKASQNQFNTILTIMEKGVIGFDSFGTIETCNDKADNLLGPDIEYEGMHIREIITGQVFDEYNRSRKQMLDRLIRINDKAVTLSIFPVSDIYGETEGDHAYGSFAILENFEEREDTQNKLRLQLANKGHVAKYTTENIIGQSDAVIKMKKLILRMGNSKSSVLISGESGTGKELIAQAIHNASPIRDKQFVAINCAALSANLLESELFGYEAGAFTGASKRGKAGIFELAHNGTLFLDEIGEMPLDLQVKLLRVIQEGEVMRVGGNKVIKVDVRVVAATNKNLRQQVKKGHFRKDLFYRLNVLPIHVPSLLERNGDVEVLIDYFKKLGNCSFALSDQVLIFLNDYKWDGNIRELRNCVEFFENIGTDVIKMDHLPYHMKEEIETTSDQEGKILYLGLDEKESYVLKLFYQAYKDRKKLGRKSISDMAYDDLMFLSEYDVRSILKTLKNEGYINVSSGRGGSSISRTGIELIEK